MTRRSDRGPFSVVPDVSIRVWLTNGQYTTVKAQRIAIPGFDKFAFYAHKGSYSGESYYAVTEGLTGLKVATTRRSGELVEATICRIAEATGAPSHEKRRGAKFEAPLIEGINRFLDRCGPTNTLSVDRLETYRRLGIKITKES